MPTNRQAGFSLIEILSVLFIMAVLATIGIAAFRGPQTKVNVGDVKTDVSTAANTLMQWGTQQGGFTGLDPAQAKALLPDLTWVTPNSATPTNVPTAKGNEMMVYVDTTSANASSNGRYAVVRQCVPAYFDNKDALCLEIGMDPYASGGGGIRHMIKRFTEAGAAATCSACNNMNMTAGALSTTWGALPKQSQVG